MDRERELGDCMNRDGKSSRRTVGECAKQEKDDTQPQYMYAYVNIHIYIYIYLF